MKAALERTAVETKTNECFKKNICARLTQIKLPGLCVTESKKIKGPNVKLSWRWIELILSTALPQVMALRTLGGQLSRSCSPWWARSAATWSHKAVVRQNGQLMERITCMWSSDFLPSVYRTEYIVGSHCSMYPTIRAAKTVLRERDLQLNYLSRLNTKRTF